MSPDPSSSSDQAPTSPVKGEVNTTVEAEAATNETAPAPQAAQAEAASVAAPAAPVDGFAQFALDGRLRARLMELGFTTPTDIQEASIPPLLEGRDLIGRARTGSGKTAAFGLPLLERVKDGGRHVRALVLAPTRELALQVTDALADYCGHLKVAMLPVYGGTPYRPQLEALRRGVSVVVGTPGRILDHMDRGSLDLSHLEMLVLDEADEMLRMGFIDDVERIFGAAPPERQVVLFSATMPRQIRRMIDNWLPDPLEIQVEQGELTVNHIKQQWMHIPQHHKLEALVRVLRSDPDGATLVFARTRASCAEAADALSRRGVTVDALHGDLNQAARERVLRKFRARRLSVVIATDVAARGLDVDHITRVVNLDLPTDKETYVHRIGRTGRAGREGLALSFVTPRERRRIFGLAQILKTDIVAVDVPSDAAIARSQRKGLQTRLEAELAEDSGDTATWLETVREDTGWTDAQIAAAAVQIVAKLSDVSLAPVPTDEPPEWARRRPPQNQERPGRFDANTRGDRGRRGDERGVHGTKDPRNEVEIFLPVGRFRGVRPNDLVGALANECGVPGNAIGRISIFDRKSFVGLPREVAEQMLRNHPTLGVRGGTVPMQIAFPRPEGDSAGPPKGGAPFQGGPPGRGPQRPDRQDGGGWNINRRPREEGRGPVKRAPKRYPRY